MGPRIQQRAVRSMKFLWCLLALVPSTGATLLRTRHTHPWYAATAGQSAAADSDCHPKCAWNCGEPECSRSCKAVCQPPKCFTACNKPQEQDCRHVCKDPKCAVVCPAQNCESEHCPPPACETVCGEPVCHLECGHSQGCETTCDDPVCTFDCSWAELVEGEAVTGCSSSKITQR
eukprot:Skav231445  [mRNA]  locus=scaffold1847:343388:349936:- [translate_table: standard]